MIREISYSAPVAEPDTFIGPNGGVVTATLVVPQGQGPFPAVIYGHWCMPGSEKKNRTQFLDEAVVLGRSGVISLLPDHVIVHPGFVDDDTPLNEQQIAVEVQQHVNLRRGADLLLSRPDVDPRRLAYVGHSCDATAGGFLSGIDKASTVFPSGAGRLRPWRQHRSDRSRATSVRQRPENPEVVGEPDQLGCPARLSR